MGINDAPAADTSLAWMWLPARASSHDPECAMLAANTERTSPGHHDGATRWSCWVQQPAPSPTVDRPARRVMRLSRSCRESGPHGRFVRHRRPVHPGGAEHVGRRGKRVDRSTAHLAAVGRCCVGIAAETRDDPTHGCGSLRSCTGRGSSPAAARSPWVNAPAGASVRSTPQLHLDTAHLDEAGFPWNDGKRLADGRSRKR